MINERTKKKEKKLISISEVKYLDIFLFSEFNKLTIKKENQCEFIFLPLIGRTHRLFLSISAYQLKIQPPQRYPLDEEPF